MAQSRKTFKYTVELHVQGVNAPNVQLKGKGDIYINICLLGIHKHSRLMPPHLPLYIDQRFYFEKIFKSCYDPQDILQRLEREHVLIEFLQADVSSPVVLASYETSAKDFLYPYSSNRIQYTGLPRQLLLSRTIEFPGVSPSFEFTTHPSIEDITGISKTKKTRKQIKPIESHGKNPKSSKLPAWKPSSAYPNRYLMDSSSVVSSSLTSPTISSAVKSDYAKRETQEKLRELAIPGEVKHIVQIDKTGGRRPFVVRHVENNLIGRRPKSHVVLNDGLVVNDYSLSRLETSMSLHSLNGDGNRSRSVSPGYNNRNSRSAGARTRSRSTSPGYNRNSTSRGRQTRSPSLSRRPGTATSQSVDFERQPYSTGRFETNIGDHNRDDEFHSTKDCAICRLHRTHIEQSRRAKSLEQQHFTTTTGQKYYTPAIYSNSPTRPVTSATLLRDPFRQRYQQSPANELSDKVIHTLRHNLESYSAQPWHNYYSSFRYSNNHIDDHDLLDRSRRVIQD